ncbi:MAG: HYR domain-containing protein [Verrucomicrobiota bacterium]
MLFVLFPLLQAHAWAPVAIAKPLVLSANSQCQAAPDASEFDNGSYDPDGGAIISRFVTPPGPYELGETLVTYTVVKNDGRSGSTNTTVTVLDLTPPSILTLPLDIAVTLPLGQPTVVVNYPAAVFAQPVTFTFLENGNGNLGPNSIFNEGGYFLTVCASSNQNLWAKTDGSVAETGLGIVSDAAHEITASTYVQIDTHTVGFTLVGFTLKSLSAGDQPGEIARIYGSNALGVLGVQLPPDVQTDGLFNISGYLGIYRYINVTVSAGGVLLHTASGYAPSISDSGAIIILPDNCSTAGVSYTPPSGTAFGVGTNIVICRVFDGAGNTNQIPFNVVVHPNGGGGGNQSPVAIAHPVITAADANCQAEVTADQVDNHSFDPDGTIVSRIIQPSGPFPVGSTPVTLTVVDNQGASSSAATTVTTLDLTPPTILTPPTDIAVTVVLGQQSVVVNYPTLTISDSCSTPGVNYTPPSGTAFGLGTNTVICRVFDAAGNSYSTTFRVFVKSPACDTIPGLIRRVQAIPLTGRFNSGRQSSTVKKLELTQRNVAQGKPTSADYRLRGFILSCEIYRRLAVLDYKTATELIDCATDIKSHLYDDF